LFYGNDLLSPETGEEVEEKGGRNGKSWPELRLLD
jgi:hypothetical protein